MAVTEPPPTITGKTPSEIVNRLEDMSKNIAKNSPGDTIVDFGVSISGSDSALALVTSAVNTAKTGVLMRLSGGTPGVTYLVTSAATMASGQVFEKSFYQPVVHARG